jgi:glucose/arabinose dehydrogenase
VRVKLFPDRRGDAVSAPLRGLAMAVAGAVVTGCAFVALRVDGRAGDLPEAPSGFTVSVIARIDSPRELAAAPNGDLIVGTGGREVELVPDAVGTPGKPVVFATLPDSEAAGVALGDGTLFVGSHTGVWRIPYRAGEHVAGAAPERIASVRQQDGGGHSTTSVAVSGDRLYASVGSSCNACTETDPTRAKIFAMSTNGANMTPKAVDIRNAIALAVDPESGALWAGVAGQDELAHGHPYEIFDDVSARAGTADYGWPTCYENRTPVSSGIDCSKVAVPRVVFPAYETPIGAAFYPLHPAGAHAFPPMYRGGAFVTLHGSWHEPLVPPRVAYVPLKNDEPAEPVNWNDPSVQWRPFLSGFQHSDQSRIGRPTGVAVGPDGSLFVADDLANVVYRIRPR